MRTQHLFCNFPAQNAYLEFYFFIFAYLEFNQEEISDKPKLIDTLQNYWPIRFKIYKVKIAEEGLF